MGGDGVLRAAVLAHLKRDAIVEIKRHTMCFDFDFDPERGE